MIKTVNEGRGWFAPKQVTVGSIADFLAERPVNKKATDLSGSFFLAGLGAGIANMINTTQTAVTEAVPAMAMPMPILGLSGGITGKIIHAFDPVIQSIFEHLFVY